MFAMYIHLMSEFKNTFKRLNNINWDRLEYIFLKINTIFVQKIKH